MKPSALPPEDQATFTALQAERSALCEQVDAADAKMEAMIVANLLRCLAGTKWTLASFGGDLEPADADGRRALARLAKDYHYTEHLHFEASGLYLDVIFDDGAVSISVTAVDRPKHPCIQVGEMSIDIRAALRAQYAEAIEATETKRTAMAKTIRRLRRALKALQ